MSVVFVFPCNLENNNYHNSSEAGTFVLLISGLSVDLHLMQIYRQLIQFLFYISSYSAGITLIEGSSIITKSAHIGYRYLYQVFQNQRNFTQKFRHLNTCSYKPCSYKNTQYYLIKERTKSTITLLYLLRITFCQF